eukprot:Plantae.Rhodophyta-Rhodochaete_pulchella.ctg45028.p2 GENE.Plantae.Rhodophyta-Rhodochaete_pulchella.ctg45028~~Plantae.Rhodophyta-Rhodochaete_pulchella.ctg45028.p2  ORF type:complete len:102 (+),score=11.94 Plantae.Rhodophyta-Rhodochaete_pulchella.ctg45028:879-1184(+)
MQLSAEEAASRGGFGGERYEKIEIQKRVRAVFERDFVPPDERAKGRWVSIECGAGRPVNDIAGEVWGVVAPVVQSAKAAPIGALWDSDCVSDPTLRQLRGP